MENFIFCAVLTICIHSSCIAFSVLLIWKSFNFGDLILELNDTSIFRWKSDTSGFLSLYSLGDVLNYIDQP